MKKYFLAIFLVSFILKANAQYPKLIVQLADKNRSNYTLQNPAQYLSQRAIERRGRYNIPIDSTDLPVNERYLDSVLLAGNVTVLSTSKWLNHVLIETTDRAAIRKILSYPFVKSAKEIGNRMSNNGRTTKIKKLRNPGNTGSSTRASRTAADTYDYGRNYNQVHIHEGEYLHNKGFRGEKMQIAVLDAGFYQYKTITAFDSIRVNGQVLGERDFVTFDNSVNEDDAHGMYCLSVLSANWPGRMVGTAPKANYWLVRTENAGSEYPVEEHNWVAGAEFADSSGADLVSSSVGYYEFDDPAFNHSYSEFYKNAAIVSKGAAIAVRKGMIVTNSAGNEGENNWKYLIFPADVDSVCTVGAANTAGEIAGFSSSGYEGKMKPNIVSVGLGTVVAGVNNQPTSSNGTSFSNPNIAGLIACLWQAFPKLNNMKILDAVYKSANRYNAPDNRYGFGIPNFRTAYQLLKHEENTALFGSEWLFVTPNLFTTSINAKFLGRVDGPARLELLNSLGNVITTQNFITEKEELYNYTFANTGTLPAGFYTIKYTDNTTTRSIRVQKGNIFERDWLVVAPNPFINDVAVNLRAPETGEINLRLVDAKGSVVDMITKQATQNEAIFFRFNNVSKLQAGVYFLEYQSKTQKRTIKLLKG